MSALIGSANEELAIPEACFSAGALAGFQIVRKLVQSRCGAQLNMIRRFQRTLQLARTFIDMTS
jgi:fucose permease